MSILLTGPAVEPVSLAEAKSHLRIEHDDDDDVAAAFTAGAISKIPLVGIRT